MNASLNRIKSKSILLTCFSISDNLLKPQLLGPNQENKTALLGDSATFHCAVQSSGPTEIQWLKQLHEHQQPKNPNKTVIVFDYIFEVSI